MMKEVICDAIFVVGNSRSGTTMMSRILGLEPSVFSFNELHFFCELWSQKDREKYITSIEAERLASKLLCIQRDGYLHQKNPRHFSEDAKTIVASMQTDSLLPEKVFEAFLHYETLKNRKIIPCDQTGHNIFYIAEILENFPKARIVNMIRDPRAVLLSQKYRWKRNYLGDDNPSIEAVRSWFNYNPITISMIYKTTIQSAERYIENPNFHSVYYEKLLNNPEETIHEICNFLGLTFQGNLLEVPQIGSSCRNDRPDRRGIDKERAKSWQMGGLNSAEIYLCQTITKKLMTRHNYSPVYIRPNLMKLIYYIASFPAKLIISFILNFKRMKNICESIKRRLF